MYQIIILYTLNLQNIICELYLNKAEKRKTRKTDSKCRNRSSEYEYQSHTEQLPMYKPFISPGDLPDPGVKPRSPRLQADALPSEPPGKPLP